MINVRNCDSATDVFCRAAKLTVQTCPVTFAEPLVDGLGEVQNLWVMSIIQLVNVWCRKIMYFREL